MPRDAVSRTANVERTGQILAALQTKINQKLTCSSGQLLVGQFFWSGQVSFYYFYLLTQESLESRKEETRLQFKMNKILSKLEK